MISGLNTIQCMNCGWVTRIDGATTPPGVRFTKTIHEKHADAKDPATSIHEHEVPVEG